MCVCASLGIHDALITHSITGHTFHFTHAAHSALPKSAQLLGVTSDHNFLFKSLDSLTNEKLLVGYNDEVTDIRFVSGGAEVAVATNSAQIRVFDKATHACRMLSAHTDTVLALDASSDGSFLASGGKDHTARVR